jgi:arylsulfatase A-like enzyme
MADPHPNVLLVIVDEWRAQAFGHRGDPNAHTPTIDAFAAESVDFANAVSGTPVCCPARASFMTGQYPLNHGVYVNDVELKPTGPTLASTFADAGYETGYIGKWHLYGSPAGWFERRAGFVPVDRRLGYDYWKGAECTHDYNDSHYYQGNDPTRRTWPGYDAWAQTDDAVRFVKERAGTKQPWFLTLSYGPPHFPLDSAPEQFRALYRDREIVLRDNVPDDVADQATADLRGYYAHIAAVDECFARLLDAVDSVDDDVIVVFTSDHGDMLWSHGLEYKLMPWEESIRVPLLIRHRGVLEPRRSNALANSPDLMPTLLGLAGLDIPGSVDGTDLSSGPGPETAYLSAPVPFSTMRWTGFSEYRGVRDTRFTYVETLEGPWLLYDHHDDPYQMRNRCGDPELAEEQRRLRAELQQWRERLDDAFLPAEAHVERDGLGHYFELNEPLGSSTSPWGDWHSTSTRARAYSIDTPLEVLAAEPAAWEVVRSAWPAVDEALRDWARPEDSLRLTSMLRPSSLDPSILENMDTELLNIPTSLPGLFDRVRKQRGSTKADRLPEHLMGQHG